MSIAGSGPAIRDDGEKVLYSLSGCRTRDYRPLVSRNSSSISVIGTVLGCFAPRCRTALCRPFGHRTWRSVPSLAWNIATLRRPVERCPLHGAIRAHRDQHISDRPQSRADCAETAKKVCDTEAARQMHQRQPIENRANFAPNDPRWQTMFVTRCKPGVSYR